MTQTVKQRFYKILPYGCQMNFSDGERFAGQLERMGYKAADTMENADIIILNTCCVRESAEKKIYGKIGEIKHLKQSNPDLVLGITGCMAQKDGDAIFKKAPHVDFVLGTNRMYDLPAVLDEVYTSRGHVAKLSGDYDMPPGVEPAQSDSLFAYVPIMYGCNNFCTYCIVPYVRGRERSRSPQEIIAEIEKLAAGGVKEVMLLGQNVNSYGKDRDDADFADLLAMADEVKGIERIRYMTSHPRDLTDKVIDVIKNSRHICDHFHLPVQYGTDKMIKAMNRGYTISYYKELIAKIRAKFPDASFTTDLIVGFPGETDEDFQQMLAFLKEIRYDAAYTFLYSKRSGTPAAAMENQVPQELKKERLHKLMEVQNEISLEINETYLGKSVEVMVEGPSKTDENVFTGHTRNNKIVLWPHGAEKIGDIVHVKITHPQTWVLKGELEALPCR